MLWPRDGFMLFARAFREEYAARNLLRRVPKYQFRSVQGPGKRWIGLEAARK